MFFLQFIVCLWLFTGLQLTLQLYSHTYVDTSVLTLENLKQETAADFEAKVKN